MPNEHAKKSKKHSKQLAKILEKFADCGAHFIFGCELHKLREGVKKVNINIDKFIHNVLPNAQGKTYGAYFAVNNCRPAQRTKVTTMQSGVFRNFMQP